MVQRLRRWLGREVDGAPLAYFRIGFGLIVFWEVLRYFYYDWITELFVKPTYFFAFPGLALSPWSRGGMYVHFFVLGIAALGLALGFYTRICAIVVALALTYVFLLDASYSLDLNHLYLMCLFALILVFLPVGNVVSLDQRLAEKPGPGTVPFWPLFLLRAQIFLVFLFAGLAKLDPEWLHARPATRLLAQPGLSPFAMHILGIPHADQIMIYGGLFIDLTAPWLLLARRTRPLGFAAVGAFLCLNGLLFHIGVFPCLALLATAMFVAPSRLGAMLRGPRLASRHGDDKAIGSLALGLLGIYLATQALLPIRAWLYPQPSGWSEEGHFFAWRMMLLEKKGRVSFTIRDPRSGREANWDMARDLTPLQIASVETRPLLVMQYAHHIADQVEAHEGFRPQVYAKQILQLGDHAPQLAIDPNRDLASEGYRLGTYDWIVPLAP